MLWNVFYADAACAIRAKECTEIVFADDLNRTAQTTDILNELQDCQHELHKWGRASQVVFDATKESMHILSRTNAYGDSFVLLGVRFECKLYPFWTSVKAADGSSGRF